MRPLYAIASELETLLGDVEGELTSDWEEKLSSLEMEREKKALDIACLVKSLEGQERMIRAAESVTFWIRV